VHCFGRGGTRIEYEHRTVAVDQVFRFIDARS
jgi:hypothetical protein